ncbi:unnamed protein product [Nyctereutes procyonoides]|uniref:(raccoon dog) hypothetical protein n=1 Tax=Nyctereutes procyonoides TaxID=34880 RepID=A0A811Y5K0_NYCPR|nr:unnamed protein product [Nyctereutes procyonoides]
MSTSTTPGAKAAQGRGLSGPRDPPFPRNDLTLQQDEASRGHPIVLPGPGRQQPEMVDIPKGSGSRGPGGAWAAKVISDARENSQRITDLFKFGNSSHGAEDSKADQAANKWGRSGKDPNHFRPAGLPSKY